MVTQTFLVSSIPSQNRYIQQQQSQLDFELRKTILNLSAEPAHTHTPKKKKKGASRSMFSEHSRSCKVSKRSSLSKEKRGLTHANSKKIFSI